MINPLFVIESGPSTAARALTRTTRLTVRNALKVGVRAMHLPWPYGALELLARAVPSRRASTTVELPHTTAQLVHAPRSTHASGVSNPKVVLYFHGGAFIVCGVNTHRPVIRRLSKYTGAPVFAVDYRMCPGHSVDMAIEDCLDAYYWLRDTYRPEQIVLAGDSAGGYLALATAVHLRGMGERPAALTLLSPLLQLDPGPKKAHPNMKTDAMFVGPAFDGLACLIRKANGGGLYEPLRWLLPDLPPVLIHVSGSEVLLHDAELAARRLGEMDVPVEVVIWPGQIHVFQIAASMVPEAKRSLQQIGAYITAVTSNIPKCYDNDLTYRTATVGL